MKAEITEVIRNNTVPAVVGDRDVLCINEASIGHLIDDLWKLFKQANVPTKNDEDEAVIDDVIDLMNETWGSGYRKTSASNRSFIRARINDGHTKEEMLMVIKMLGEKWGKDIRMQEYLRPVTVFAASKFEGYLSQALRVQGHLDNMVYVQDAFGNKRRITKQQFGLAEAGFFKRLD